MPDFTAYNWRELAPNGGDNTQWPSARVGHAMVWDGSRIIMFGGHNQVPFGYGVNAETWEFDGTDWNQLFPATSPSARSDHSMVWDGSQVILHGGASASSGGLGLQDTWTFNGATWTNVTPAGTKPTVRMRHLAVWNGSAMIIYGGQTGSAVKKDTWSWNGSAWTQLTPTNYIKRVTGGGTTPALSDGRAAMPAVWEPGGSRILTFSGFSDSGGGGEFDTYPYQESGGGTWQYASSDWTQVGPTTNPDARFEQGICITDDDEKTLMYGGNVSPVGSLGYIFNSEFWQYDGSDWEQIVRAVNPDSRTTQIVWDDATARVLLFGGGQPGLAGGGYWLNDTWEFATDVTETLGVYMPATSIPIE